MVDENRPNNVRVVFDVSATFHGTSLKSALWKGAGLLTSLVGVLLRFRRFPVPLSADIEKMYLQAKVPAEDQSSLRFIWRQPYSSGSPHSYKMLVHIFCAISSPATCLFTQRRTTEENRKRFPKVADLVRLSRLRSPLILRRQLP